MNTPQYLTVGEMMIHFRIADKYYNSFASWVSKHAKDMTMPGETRKFHKKYDLAAITKAYPYNYQFNTFNESSDVQAAAELLASAMEHETGQSVTVDMLLSKLRQSENREHVIQTLVDIQREIVNNVIHFETENKYTRKICGVFTACCIISMVIVVVTAFFV